MMRRVVAALVLISACSPEIDSPPPKLDRADPPVACIGQAGNATVITGQNFTPLPTRTLGTEMLVLPKITLTQALDEAGTPHRGQPITIPDDPLNPSTSHVRWQSEQQMSFDVPPEINLLPGTYDLTVTNPDGKSDTLAAGYAVEMPPIVETVAPATVCAGGGLLTVNGMHFVPTPSIRLVAQGQQPISGTVSNLDSAGTHFDAVFGPGAVVGVTYDVVVANPHGCADTPPHQKVTGISGPIAYFADPQVVYNQVNMRVTIFLTGVTGTLAPNAVTMVPNGATMPVTQLTWNAVAGHPGRIQVVIPMGQAPGVYDLYIKDSTDCSAILPKAIVVVDMANLQLQAMDPPFGWTNSDTAVTILRNQSSSVPFVATPRAFLNPHNPGPTDVAIPLSSVAFGDTNTLTAVVPIGQPAGSYDLIVTNPYDAGMPLADPNGSVGFLPSAFTITDATHPPPAITAVTPSSIIDQSGQVVTVVGTNFRGSTISVTCKDAGGATLTPGVVSGTVNCGATQCTQTATIDGAGLPVGSVCVLRLTNSDGTFTDYSAIGVTNSSLNLSSPRAGTQMVTGRRALVASAGSATAAAHFVYAIGGDSGTPAAPLATTEFTAVDQFGAMGTWALLRYPLPGPRTLAGSARVGRYTYVFGGMDGTNPLATAVRAIVLDPAESPIVDVNDLLLADTGLDAGYWIYRVSAVFSAADPDNPNGESLASDEFIVRLPDVPNKKIQVSLTWAPPRDALGALLPNVTGYQIYRTPLVGGASGQEVLLSTVGNVTTFTDDGSATPGTETPLPLGSMGQWALLPNLGTPRMAPGGAAAFSPSNPQELYVYALYGESAPATVVGSYEYLTVTVAANGHQSVSAAWTPGVQTSGQPRWQLAAFVVDSTVSALYNTGPYVFMGGGINGANVAAQRVEAGAVTAGGQLASIDDTPNDFNNNQAGYCAVAANNQLFALGGVGAVPSTNGKSASLISPRPSLAGNAWNDLGSFALTHARYLMGSTVQNAFIFLVGGQTDQPSPASKTTEVVIW
jgi:hypothetical protein